MSNVNHNESTATHEAKARAAAAEAASLIRAARAAMDRVHAEYHAADWQRARDNGERPRADGSVQTRYHTDYALRVWGDLLSLASGAEYLSQ